jgi:hypothetical protein
MSLISTANVGACPEDRLGERRRRQGYDRLMPENPSLASGGEQAQQGQFPQALRPKMEY